jgi:hypothetical protein
MAAQHYVPLQVPDRLLRVRIVTEDKRARGSRRLSKGALRFELPAPVIGNTDQAKITFRGSLIVEYTNTR